jgi:hypothetical protein
LLITGPLVLSRGFALVGDMVFVPRQPWKAQWLGADGSVPRAVPVDAIVSALTYVVPGDLLQKAVLLGLLAAAGWGVLHLLRESGLLAALGAAVLYVWNPYVYERLAIGHWALLCGYAALPWVVDSAWRLTARRGGLLGLWVSLAVAAWTSPTGGLMASGVALAVAAAVPRRLPVVALPAVLLNLPWVVPGMLNAHGSSSAVSGVAAFAAHSDSAYGIVGSLLAFGGMWKTSVAPTLAPAALYATLSLLLGVAGAGFGLYLTLRDRSWLPGSRPLWLVALAGLALALTPALPGGREVMEWGVREVPGAGILRDSQKWLAPYVLVASCGFGVLVARLRRGALRAVCIALPVLALPTLVWGLGGVLRPVQYPQEWQAAADRLEAAGASNGRTAVLPWSAYRRFTWANEHAVLDPAFRFFPGQVLTSDDLKMGEGRTVAGEDPDDRRISEALGRGELSTVLRELDVRWVLVEKHTPGAGSVQVPPGKVIHDGSQLRVVDLGGPSRVVASPYAAWYYVVDGVVVAAFFAAVLRDLARRRSRLY